MSESNKPEPETSSAAGTSDAAPASPLQLAGHFWWESRWGWLAPFLLFLALCGYFRFGLYSQYMWNDDIPSYLFAADTFALGRLKVPVPPPDNTQASGFAFFRTWMVVPNDFTDVKEDGTPYKYMYSRYGPGHPLLLLAGKMVLGAYEYVPILLMGLTALGIYRILQLTEGERIARWGLTLMAASPFFLAYGSSLLSHNSTILFLTGGTLFYVLMNRADRKGRRFLWGFLAAFFYGGGVAVRPLTGACFILAVILWEFCHVRRNAPQVPVRWLSMFLGGALALSGLLWYNHQLTGSPTRFPFTQYWPRDTLGFTSLTWRDTRKASHKWMEEHKNEFKGEDSIGTTYRHYMQHTPWNGVHNLGQVLNVFNDYFLIFPSALALLVLLMLLFRDRLCEFRNFYLLQAGMVIFGHYFYFAHGSFAWGPRYYFACLLPAFLLMAPLAAHGWARLKETRLLSPAVAFAAIVILSVMHTSATCYEHWEHQLEKQEDRRTVERNVMKTVKPPAIVFLPPPHRSGGRYVGHFEAQLRNDPLHRGPILYAINNGALGGHLTRLHPNRRIYEIQSDGSVEEKKRSDYIEFRGAKIIGPNLPGGK